MTGMTDLSSLLQSAMHLPEDLSTIDDTTFTQIVNAFLSEVYWPAHSEIQYDQEVGWNEYAEALDAFENGPYGQLRHRLLTEQIRRDTIKMQEAHAAHPEWDYPVWTVCGARIHKYAGHKRTGSFEKTSFEEKATMKALFPSGTWEKHTKSCWLNDHTHQIRWRVTGSAMLAFLKQH